MAVQANLRIEGEVRVQAESRWVRIDRNRDCEMLVIVTKWDVIAG